MVSWYEEYFPTEWLFVTNAGQWFREEFILGKRYWFIQWLLDNDKIDFRKLDDNPDWYDINTNREYLDLVALISIQDNPIEFLVSILK